MNMANIMNDFLFEKIFFSEPCCLLFSILITGTGFNLFTSKRLFVMQCKHYFWQLFYSAMIGDKGILTFFLEGKKREEKLKAALQNLV